MAATKQKTADEEAAKPQQKQARARGKSVAYLLAKLIGSEPKSIGELVEGMRSDYQVRLCELTLQAMMQTVPVTINCEEQGLYSDEHDQARVDALCDHLTTLWHSRWQSMQEAIAYGRVAYEKVWGFDRDHGLQYLEDVEPLPFKQTTMLLDDEGHFNGINLRVSEEDQIDLEPIKSWWLAIDTTATEPHGKSRFLGAPQKVWLERRKLFKLRELFMNRCVLKGGVAHIPMGAAINEQGITTDDSMSVEQAFEAYVSGGLFLLPNTRDTDTKQYEYDLQLPEGLNDPAPLDAAIDGSDVEQTRAFGIPEKTIMEGDAVGSYAMVSLQMLVLYSVCDDILGQMIESFQKYVIDGPTGAIEQNFSDGFQPKITISAPKLARQPDSMVVEIAKNILTSGQLSPLVMAGAVDILAMLKGLDIPVSNEAEQIITEMVAKFRAAPAVPEPPPGAPTGPPPQATLSNQPSEKHRENEGSESLTAHETQSKTDPDSDPSDSAQNPSAALSRVPTLDELADEAAAEAARIWEQINFELGRGHASYGLLNTANVERLLDELRQLKADSTTAAKLLGMVSLWKPTVNSVPDGFSKLQKTATLSNQPTEKPRENEGSEIHTGGERQYETCCRYRLDIDPLTGNHTISDNTVLDNTVTMALPGAASGDPLSGPPEGARIRFSFVEQAVQWVLTKELATSSEVSQMARADKLKVFTAPGIDDIPTLQQLRQQVSDSLAMGESLYNFRKKLSDDLQLKRHEVETLYRTNTKQAYDEGLNKTLEKPHVNERFGYVLYVATRDNRVRSSHWELDGLVAKVGSPLHKIFLAARADWNCRCGLIPLTYEQAKARGVSDYGDLPEEVTQKYAGAI